MKTSHLPLLGVLLLACGNTALSDIKNVQAAILPHGVVLGMSTETLKKIRTNIFPGPGKPATNDNQGHNDLGYESFMEIEGMGKPGHVSYWFFAQNGEVIGVVRTRALIGVSDLTTLQEPDGLYRLLAHEMGSASSRPILRKGKNAFVPVQADVWKDASTGWQGYYVATDQELSLAIVDPARFPLAEVFINPQDSRFELEPSDQRTIHDRGRPVIRETPDDNAHKDSSGHMVEPLTAVNSKAKMPLPKRGSPEAKSATEPAFTIHLLLIAITAVFVASAVFWFKFRKPRAGADERR